MFLIILFVTSCKRTVARRLRVLLSPETEGKEENKESYKIFVILYPKLISINLDIINIRYNRKIRKQIRALGRD